MFGRSIGYFLIFAYVDDANATLAGHRSVCKESCDVVASHPLFVGLFKEISAKYSELAALFPEISKVARAAVATPKGTATPAEQLEESLQALRKATNNSALAEEAMGNHSKKLEAVTKRRSWRKNAMRRALGSLVPKMEWWRDLRHQQLRGMDLDETDAQVQETEAALARKGGVSR